MWKARSPQSAHTALKDKSGKDVGVVEQARSAWQTVESAPPE
jgi:hypothetical protein